MHDCFGVLCVTEVIQPGMSQLPSDEFRWMGSSSICLGTITNRETHITRTN